MHEYGGGMYVAFIGADGAESVIFSDQADQRLYRQDLRPAGEAQPAHWTGPRPLTPAPPAERAHRYADGRVTPDGRLLVTVRERHEAGGDVVNELVSLPSDGSAEPSVIASGHDFYAAPRLSPDGRRLAWLSWDHPLMPWDGTELWTAELAGDGSVSGERLVAGGPQESILQPLWSPGGDLWFASDRTGWWNLYAVALGTGGGASGGETGATSLPEPCPLIIRDAEFVKVPWVFGLQHYVFLADGTLAVSYTEDGSDHLAVLDAAAGGQGAAHEGSDLRELEAPYSVVYSLAPLGERVALIAGMHTEGLQVAVVDPRTGDRELVRRGRRVLIDPAYISRPEAIVFPTEGGLSAHANYYPPANPDFVAPDGELPPLLVNVHGGPTSAHEAMLDLDIQYWTSRGIAVVDVNYGGSTGYGREYRERLRGEWGVVDTVDSINAARYLVARGDADPARLGVRGGSAGGYTTLNALTRFEVFSAGCSLFGLADLEAFATGGTHKFESRYLDSMLGPYPAAPGRLPRALTDPSRRRHQLPGHPAPGTRGRDRAAGAGGHHRRGHAAKRAAVRLHRVRGRAARLPQGGEHHPLRGSGAVLLRTRVGIRPGRRDRAGRDREPGLSAGRLVARRPRRRPRRTAERRIDDDRRSTP